MAPPMTATTLSKHWSDTSEIKLGQSISLGLEFSVFIKSGHELYRFSLCQLFPFDSIREKTGKQNTQKNKPFYSI